MDPVTTVKEHAARHAALGDPGRLAIIDELFVSDRAPTELCQRLGMESNLLAHHLHVLSSAGMIERSRSSGDQRRRYVHLVRESFEELTPRNRIPLGQALFVCSANSARSQLAAALWRQATGEPALSAGTHPADCVHPGAVAAAQRAGLDLSSATPRDVAGIDSIPPLAITVCDRAHEEIGARESWLHWSVPDPVSEGKVEAFDSTVEEIRDRIRSLLGPPDVRR